MNPPAETDLRTAVYLRAAAGCLSSRASVVAIAVLLCNDHLLKVLVPSWLTGKLSDLAGLYFAPYFALLIVFGAAWTGQLPGRAGAGRPRTVPAPVADVLATSVFVAVGVWFAALKLAPATAEPALALLEMATGRSHALVVDPSDLLALIVLPISHARWHRLAARGASAVGGPVAPASGALWTRLAQCGRVLVVVLAGAAMLATSPPVVHSVVGLAADPNAPGALYALVAEQGGAAGPGPRVVVYQTSDAGDTWRRHGASGVAGGLGRVIPDPAQPGRVYLATPVGVWRLDESAAPRRVWPSPDQPSVAGGGTANLPTAAPPWGAGALYVGAPGALVRTVDGGASWARLPLPGPTDGPVTALAAGPDGGMLYAAQERHLWRSRDGGSSWEQLATLDADPSGLWAHPTRRGVLLATTPTSLLTSDDGGLTWRQAAWEGDPAVPLALPPVSSIAFDPENDAVALAAAPGNGVLSSADAGRSWVLALGADALDVAVTRPPVHRVLAAAGWQGVYRQRSPLRWPWLQEWESANAGLAGRLPSGLPERLIDVASSLAALTGVIVSALLAARLLAPAALRRALLGHPWELVLAVWTLFPAWLLLGALLQRRALDAALVATIPALGALVILAKARWSWVVRVLAALPIVLMSAVLASLYTDLSPGLAVAAIAATLALMAWLLPARAAKPLLIGVGALVYLTPWAIAGLIWLVS